MSVRKALLASALVLLVGAAAPAKAAADWLFTPWVGMNFGGSATFNDALGDFEDEFERRGNFGASLGYMGGGIVGFEVDFGWAPNFFQPTEGDDDFEYGDSNLTTLMANVIVGVPVGGQTGAGLRPYLAGGLGLMRARADSPQDFLGDLDRNDLGFNLGGGVSGFFSDNVGVRGDLRYFRQLREAELDEDDVLDVTVGDLKFWRASVGLVFRFGS
jgi:opacity protein-like surface antigen